MKNSTIPFLLVLALMQCSVLTQAQDLRFSKVFYNPNSGMHVLASVEAGQDSLLMISSTGEGSDNGAVHLMDANGVMHWSKSLMSQDNLILPVDIVRTADRSFLICATETNFNPTKHSVLLIKLSAAGEFLWVKKFEHEINTFPSGISLSGGGDILVTGRAELSNYPYKSKLLLLRFKSDGALLWSKTYETASLRDEGLAVAELADGQLMVGGLAKGSGVYDVELSLTQMDAGGNVLWAKRKISPGGYPYSTINDLIAGPSGFYLLGSASDAPGMAMAVGADGEISWSKSLNIFSSGWGLTEYRGRIITTSDNNILLSTGSLYGDGMVFHLAADGSINWSQYTAMQSMVTNPLSDGGYLFLGIGPMIGVKDVYLPQTGVIRTNALGEGVSCTNTGGTFAEDYVPEFENMTYTLSDVGSVGDYSLQWEEFPLDYFDGCVEFYGVVEETPDAANALIVYPNPGNGPFRLLLEDMQPESVVQLSVYNSKGQNVYSREGDWSRLQVIDRQFPAGLYLINVKAPGRVFTTRLIVR